MESVQTFEVQLNVENCSTLYDFIRGEQFIRPSTGWDMMSVLSKSNYSHQTAAAMKSRQGTQKGKTKFQTHLYLMHTSTGCFEKNKLNSIIGGAGGVGHQPSMLSGVFGSETNHVTLPPWLLPVYQPGEVIKGQVVLATSNSIRADNVHVTFFGQAKVKIRKGRDVYSARKVFTNKRSVLWSKHGGKFANESAGGASVGDDSLPPGFKQFQFTFRIPNSTCSSVPYISAAGPSHAYISYFLKVTLDKGKCLRFGNVVCHQPIWISQVKPVPELSRPLKLTQSKKVGIFSNDNNIIQCTISTLKRCYVKGETVQVGVEVDNRSNTVISDVVGHLEIIVRMSTAGEGCCLSASRDHQYQSQVVRSGVVNPGMAPHFRMDIPQKFPSTDGHLMPPCPFAECSLVLIGYQVVVTVKISGLVLNMTMRLPIEIGTERMEHHDRVSQGAEAFAADTLISGATKFM